MSMKKETYAYMPRKYYIKQIEKITNAKGISFLYKLDIKNLRELCLLLESARAEGIDRYKESVKKHG